MIKEASRIRALKDGARRYRDALTGKTVKNVKAANNENLMGAKALSKAKSDRNRARLLTAGGLAALGLGARAALKNSKTAIKPGFLKSIKKNPHKAVMAGAGGVAVLDLGLENRRNKKKLNVLLAGNKKKWTT